LLGNWKIVLDEKREALREEERELVMNLSPAYLKWKEETLRAGEQRGIEIGEQRGIEIGEQQRAEGIARNMLAAGMAPTQIAQLTGLSLDQLQQLLAE